MAIQCLIKSSAINVLNVKVGAISKKKREGRRELQIRGNQSAQFMARFNVSDELAGYFMDTIGQSTSPYL